MLKKLLLTLAMIFLAIKLTFALEVNTADKAALDGINEIGTKTAAAIISERDKGGKFKDWDDLIHRVKGVGPKNSTKMSVAGLTVNGQSKPGAAKVSAAKETQLNGKK